MRERAGGFLKTITVTYLMLILVALPLYMRDGLKMIGDAKYYFFRNVSLMLAAAWAVGVCVYFFRSWVQYRGQARSVRGDKFGKRKPEWSPVDWCVALFGASSVVSCVFSSYKAVAVWGYSDWHMGLITQLLLVWSYFLVSRWYDGDLRLWAAAGIGCGAVALFGAANRLGADPLGVFRNMDFWDWNRRNLLSTIGNINWYCGYLCTVLPIAVFFFWRGRGWLRAVAGAVTGVGIFSVFTQGSESGFVAVAAIMAVLLWCSLGGRRLLLRFLQTLLWVPCTCLGGVLAVRVFRWGLFLPEGNFCVEVMFWKGWAGVLALLLLGILFLLFREKRSCRDMLCDTGLPAGIKAVMAAGIAGGALLFGLCQISDGFWKIMGSHELLRFDDAWGNGRGALWRISMQGMARGGIRSVALGAGPDCFAPYIYGLFDVDRLLQVSGQWQGAVFANAHNEWLNMLVTQGAPGALAYGGIFLGIFVKCIRRSRENPFLLMGALCVAGYVANNFFSFQQITAAPLIFAIAAMCEGMCRKKKEDAPENKWIRQGVMTE